MRTLTVLALAVAAGLAAPAVAAVGIPPVPVIAAGFHFISPILVVPVGTTVEWRGEALPHTVTTSDSLEDALAGRANDRLNHDGQPDTFHKNLPVGVDVQHTYDAPGSFAYFCEVHRALGMVGLVEVR